MKRPHPMPPKLFHRFFRWYCNPKLVDHIEGDMLEEYGQRLRKFGKRKADLHWMLEVVFLCRPGIIRPSQKYRSVNQYAMYKSYFKISWRNLLRNKGYAVINVGGLALGMSVALLIGLWIYDELSFNKYHENYDRIARMTLRYTDEGEIGVSDSMPFPLVPELNKSFPDDFEYLVMSTSPEDHIISYQDKKFRQEGNFIQPAAPEMLTLRMSSGTRSGLNDMNSVLLSKSSAVALFGSEDPINKMVKIDNAMDVKVTGVYEDLPMNSEFHDVKFMAPWDLYISFNKGWLERFLPSWGDGMLQIYAQMPAEGQMENVSEKIKHVVHNHEKEENKIYKKEAFLFPMNRWHLYEEFENGKSAGGKIQFVWLFGIIGVFVLLLACINFMNLSTARSEKRAKEVGICKSVGSHRSQLIHQFFSESILITMLAFVLSIAVVLFVLPWFNTIANKQILFPYTNPWFWMSCVAFTLLTGIIAGSYPALYLSSFHAVKVLKGTFRAGRFASLPRQVLVTLQFTVSVTLIIGTIIVYQQIQFTKERPVGYSREQLVYVNTSTPDIHEHFEAIRNKLMVSGAIVEMTESNSATTENYQSNFGGFEWKGKTPEQRDVFGVTWVQPEYGKTVGWQFLKGRDFSRERKTDEAGMVINESAAQYMGLEDPVGEIVMLDGHQITILGVVKDMVVGSPFVPTRKAIYMSLRWPGSVVTLKLNPAKGTQEALAKAEAVFKEFAPALPFDYVFADDDYANKFSNEVRIGSLAFIFAGLAILISCLGLFGLASFVAEQRTKEIGIRKVVGASIFSLWRMLSKDFIVLIIIACIIAIPMAYYFMNNWLQTYQYRTEISWWVFVATATGSLAITLITVSYQAISAALMNPVKSLRSE